MHMQANMMSGTAFNLLDNEVITTKNFTFSSSGGMLTFALPDINVTFTYVLYSGLLTADYTPNGRDGLHEIINFSEDQKDFLLKHMQMRIITGLPTQLEKFLIGRQEASKVNINLYDRGKQEDEGDNKKHIESDR